LNLSPQIFGELHAVRGNYAQALADFQQGLESNNQVGHNLSSIPLLGRAWFAAALGQVEEIQRRVEATGTNSAPPEALAIHLDFSLAQVGWELLQGRPLAAQGKLDLLRSQRGAESAMSWQSIGFDLLLTEVKRQQGRLEQADIDTLVAGRLAGLPLALRLYQPFLTRVGGEAIRRGWHADVFRQALSSTEPAQQPPRLIVRLLGSLELLRVTGERIKASSKELELLAYLLLNGPTETRLLAGILAPESRNGRNRVQRAKLDLNRSAGLPLIEAEKAGQVYRVSSRVRVDCDALQLQGDGNVQTVYSLYHGALLPSLDWAALERERLARYAAGVLERHARSLREADPQEASLWYRRAGQITPWDASLWAAYRGLSAGLGREDEVRAAESILAAVAQGAVPLTLLERWG